VPLERVIDLDRQRLRLECRVEIGGGDLDRVAVSTTVADFPAARLGEIPAGDLLGDRLKLGGELQVGEDVADAGTDVRVEGALGTEPEQGAQIDRDLGQLTDRNEAVDPGLQRDARRIAVAGGASVGAAGLHRSSLRRIAIPRGHGNVIEEDLDVADRGLHIRSPDLQGEPASEPIAGIEVEPEVVLDRRFVEDVVVRSWIDKDDRWESLLPELLAGDGDIGVAADRIAGRKVREAEPELPFPLGVFGQADRPG
jgi:hypothetical protein